MSVPPGLSPSPFKGGVVKWIDERLPIPRLLVREYGRFQVPRNLNYLWSFGGILITMMALMILSGIFLAFHYQPSTDKAFDSVERIMRDVNFGWLLRYMHMNGAHLLFVAVYIHIWRGLWYGSYKHPRELLWVLGVLMLLMMMATAFLGYTLPWGQMSFWGATVITNLFSAIPVIGDDIVVWLWGGFSVDNPTLNRFYVLHWVFAFGIVGVAVLHVIALHITGSNNPTGVEPTFKGDTVSFHPYMTAKDSVALLAFLGVYVFLVFFAPNVLGHPDNYIPANPLVTPAHIMPEWYFLPFYAILRAVPDKLGGVVLMFGSVLVLALAPWLDTSRVRSCRVRRRFRWALIAFGVSFFVLMWAGAQEASGPVVLISRVATAIYFGFFLVAMPLARWLDRDVVETPIPRVAEALSEAEKGMVGVTMATALTTPETR